MDRFEHGGDIYKNPGVILDFSVNTNPIGLPESVRRAVIDGAEDFARYPDPACRALRGALAKKHRLMPEQILCGNGASDLLFRIAAYRKPKLALTLAPTFSEYARSVTLFGGEMREYPLSGKDGFLPDGEILSKLTPELDAVYLCNPNNPTGRLCPQELLVQIADRCRENGTLLILDECFLDFTEGESLLPLLGQYPNLLILKAFTKLYAMAGLRLGYLVSADRALLDRIAAFGATWSVSSVAQKAGLAALGETSLAERTRALVSTERAYLSDSLRALGLAPVKSEANFLLVKGPQSLYEALLQRGLLLRRCANFSGLDETYFRIGVKTREGNEMLVHAIREVLHD